MGARVVGPWVGEQKPLGKSPLRGNPSPESTYLPTMGPKNRECTSQDGTVDESEPLGQFSNQVFSNM